MTTHGYQPQQFVTPPQPPQPPLVTFAAEKHVRHAAILIIVLAYVGIGLWGLLILLTLAGGLAVL